MHWEGEALSLRAKLEQQEQRLTELWETRRDARNRECVRSLLGEAHKRERKVWDNLQRALEQLLAERETELKVEMGCGEADLTC